MFTLEKAALPSSVEAEGRRHAVKTDFRYAILFLRRVKENARLAELDFIYDGDVPENRAAGARAVFSFFNPPRTLPRVSGGESGEILLDLEQDAPLVFAAFWEQYGIDLLDESLRMHWYKFRALLDGLHGTRLNEIIGYRAFRPDGKDRSEYKREMLRLKEMWRIEPELTEEEKQAVAAFDAQLAGNP